MQLPDDVALIRPSGTDAYGNPDASFVNATETPTKGFQVRADLLMLPADADVRIGDRVRVNGSTYAVTDDPTVVRSPRRTVMVQVALNKRLEV